MVSIVYVHIGVEFFPEYIYDSIYQSSLISLKSYIYVLTNKDNINMIYSKLKSLDINDNIVHCIPLETLKITQLDIPKDIANFRNNFWEYSILRFLYIEAFMNQYSRFNVLHLENDVMLYCDASIIIQDYNKNLLHLVKDAPNRVIASIMYIPNVNVLNPLIEHIRNQLKLGFKNDMELLGNFEESVCFFNIFPDAYHTNFIFDGAAIGQFLGGIDPRNSNGQSTVGFVNETCSFKPNTVNIFKKNVIINEHCKSLGVYFTKTKNTQTLKRIVNLHIHCKDLVQFSSINNINYNNIISGERLLSLCDYIILTKDILNYHVNLQNFTNNYDKVILVQNFLNINIYNLNKYINALNKKVISLHIYTHIFDLFVEYIWDHLDSGKEYILYLHNSDHHLPESSFNKIIEDPKLKYIYTQNTYIYHSKVKLLPIGIANSMFPHGNIKHVYSGICKSYNIKKTKNIYININPSTFPYRKNVLEHVKNNGSKLPYPEYLEELSKHYFCLCVRGNGVQCHREWESLYMSTIPVIIQNKHTNTYAYTKYLNDLDIPHYIVNDLSEIHENFFTKELYDKILKKFTKHFLNTPSLDLQYYICAQN